MAHLACSSATASHAVDSRRMFGASTVRIAHITQSRRGSLAQRQMIVRAEGEIPAPKPPKGVTKPPLQPEVPPARFGFVESAEVLNSRAAMLGFFGILLVEWIAGKGIFELAGISVGNGLGFEL